MLSPPRGQSTCSFGRRRANVMRPLELYASHRPRVARARAARTPSIYGSSPRCARAARRARFRAACRFGGGRPAPPYGWDTRAARATHHAPRARTAHPPHHRVEPTTPPACMPPRHPSARTHLHSRGAPKPRGPRLLRPAPSASR